MGTPTPPHPTGQAPAAPRAAVAEARQWNRDLRHAVQSAKATAKAVPACRKPGESDTPKHPAGGDDR